MNDKTKKVFGILLGLVIGAIPFFNGIAAATVAFTKKKIRMAICIAVIVIMQIVMSMQNSADISKTYKEENEFSYKISKQVSLIKTEGSEPVTLIQLQDLLASAIKTAAIQQKKESKFPLAIYDNLINDHLPVDEKKELDDLTGKIAGLYFGADSLAAAGKRFSYHALSFESQKKTGEHIDDFTRRYVNDEGRSAAGFIGFLGGFFLVIAFIINWILTVVVFRNIFITQGKGTVPEPVTTYNDTTVVNLDEVINSNDKPREDNISTPTEKEISPVKINYATEEEIAALPGVGSVQAVQIMNDRNDNGYFAGMEDFKKRVSFSERVYNNLQKSLDFSMPENHSDPSKGRVIEF